jgi:hypothetical protein
MSMGNTLIFPQDTDDKVGLVNCRAAQHNSFKVGFFIIIILCFCCRFQFGTLVATPLSPLERKKLQVSFEKK